MSLQLVPKSIVSLKTYIKRLRAKTSMHCLGFTFIPVIFSIMPIHDFYHIWKISMWSCSSQKSGS